jgi:hypothetical protein
MNPVENKKMNASGHVISSNWVIFGGSNLPYHKWLYLKIDLACIVSWSRNLRLLILSNTIPDVPWSKGVM